MRMRKYISASKPIYFIYIYSISEKLNVGYGITLIREWNIVQYYVLPVPSFRGTPTFWTSWAARWRGTRGKRRWWRTRWQMRYSSCSPSLWWECTSGWNRIGAKTVFTVGTINRGGREEREREREEITRPLNRKDRELSLPRFPLDHSLPRGEFYVGRKGNEPFSAMQSVLLLLQLTLYRGMVEKKRKKKERERIGGKEREGWRQEIRSVAF